MRDHLGLQHEGDECKFDWCRERSEEWEDGGGGEEEGEARRIETVVSTSFHRADRAVSVEGLGRLVSSSAL